MGNKVIKEPKAKIFPKEGIFFTYMELINFIETEIIYQLLPEYEEIRDFKPKKRKLLVISPSGYQEELQPEAYQSIINNPSEVRLIYDNTLVSGYEINFRFGIRYPANVRMSINDFNPKVSFNKQLVDNTELTLLEKIVVETGKSYQDV